MTYFQKKQKPVLAIISNPIYCGAIFIHAFHDQPECTLEGQYETLISEALFYKVQDIIMVVGNLK
ncbi:recombinase family protein [Chitinophaga rhizophila]|uniref:recombinase family protein n=1 Tax=Chitinophaga rhizophila TaxID=2866212 RepID=UPI0037439F19